VSRYGVVRGVPLAGVASAFTCRAARADDCSGIRDCYLQILIAALVIAAVVVLAVVCWEIFVAAGVTEGAGALLELESEEAIAAERAAAQARLESIAAEANSGGGRQNCAWLVREMDEALGDMLAGRRPNPYAPNWFNASADFAPDLARASNLAAEYGGTFETTSMQGIIDELEAAGNGARGIVRTSSGGVGHVYNVVNYGGEVFFVDAQAPAYGQQAVLTVARTYPPSTIIQFLLTSG
jgi:papain fold toxin 1 (glutamine deamidase) of polymorphic toxin system